MTRVKTVFWLLLALGAAARVVAAGSSLGLEAPDEHQQYLEEAQGIVYGPQVTFYEHDLGLRHRLYPWTLAAALFTLDRAGVRDPLAQAAALRCLVALAVLGASAVLAWKPLNDGRAPCALAFVAIVSCAPAFVYMNVRPLSETAATVPLLLGLAALDRRPALAGLAFAAAFAVRYQSALFIAPLAAVVAFQEFRRRPGGGFAAWQTSRLLAGLAAGLVAVGLIDLVTWGGFLHSPIAYFEVVILGGRNDQFGVTPWFYYLPHFNEAALATSPLLPALIVVGLWRDPRLGLAAAVYVAAHSAIGHKEYRFLWPVVPITFFLAAEGFERVYRDLAGRPRAAFAAVFALTVAAGCAYEAPRIAWDHPLYRSSAVALREVGRRPDVTGVALYGIPDFLAGNDFFLRRDVPLVTQNLVDPVIFRSKPAWKGKAINYLLTENTNLPFFKDLNPVRVGDAGVLTIYRLDRSGPLNSASSSGLAPTAGQVVVQ